MREIKRKNFDNGLVLLTERIPSKKKAALLVGVKVGSMHETVHISGGSHFNEHLLFKSNKHRGAKQIAKDLEQNGTQINAFTSETATAFYAGAFPDKLAEVIPIVYEAATNFKYDSIEFEKERQVILTEIQLRYDQPYTYSSLLFRSCIFQGTSLERDVAGTVEAMKKVTKEELENFKKEYYAPNNMAVMVVGNFDELALEQKVSETFADLSRKKENPAPQKIILANERREKLEQKKDTTQAYLHLGYIVPGTIHEDTHGLMMLDNVLSNGFSSRLFLRLREEKGIGYAVGSSYNSICDIGIFQAYVSGFDPKRFDEARSIILAEFRDLKQNLIEDKELERVKNLIRSGICDGLESIDSRAMSILEKEFDNVPYDFRKAESYVAKVTKEQIREMANKYLGDDYTLALLEPLKE